MTDRLFGDISNTKKWLYHYTSRETALEHILNNGKIRLNSFSELNDPREAKEWMFSMSSSIDNSPEHNDFFDMQIKSTEYVKNRCKVLCMVQDDVRARINSPDYFFHRGFSRPRMWAQYSNNHSGVCLIFERDSLEKTIRTELSTQGDIYFGEVEYENMHRDEVDAFHLEYDTIVNSSLEQHLDAKVKQYYRQYFFTKLEDWSSENEWRCVLRGDNTIPEFVSIDNSLCGIVIGGEFSRVYIPSITPFAEQYSVDIAQMHWRNGHPTVLPLPTKHA